MLRVGGSGPASPSARRMDLRMNPPVFARIGRLGRDRPWQMPSGRLAFAPVVVTIAGIMFGCRPYDEADDPGGRLRRQARRWLAEHGLRPVLRPAPAPLHGKRPAE